MKRLLRRLLRRESQSEALVRLWGEAMHQVVADMHAESERIRPLVERLRRESRQP